MLMLVAMTLTLTQGHSGSAKAKNQRCMRLSLARKLSKQQALNLLQRYAISVRNLDLDFANVYMA